MSLPHNFSVILLFLLHTVECRVYFIIPGNDTPCPVAYHTCVTLSEVSNYVVASFSSESDINVTLIFPPGNHSLDSEIFFSNLSELSILSSSPENDSTTKIVCSHFDAGMTIYEVSSVAITHLTFVGCGNTLIARAGHISLLKSTFERSYYSSSSLVLRDVSSASIKECFFHQKSTIQPNINDLGEGVTVDLSVTNSTHVGGAVAIFNSSGVHFENTMFDGNEACYGGAIFAELSTDVVIEDCVLHRNSATGLPSGSGIKEDERNANGGAMFVKESQVKIVNSSFTNNEITSHGNGGVLYAMNSTISIAESTFTGNKVLGNGMGGVIFALHSELYCISHCIFGTNVAHVAGVMHLESSNATVRWSDFIGNIGRHRTGAISITGNSYATFEKCVFDGNSARTLGGAVYVTSSVAVLNQIQFVSNSVEEVGAVIAIYKGGLLQVSNTTLSGNRAKVAIISAHSSDVYFDGFNKLVDNHGSLLAFNSTVKFTGRIIFRNGSTGTNTLLDTDTDVQEGGALTTYSSHVTFIGDATFLHSSAKRGGAIFALKSDVLFQSNENHSLVDKSTTVTLSAPEINTMHNNSAVTSGGAIFLYHSTVTFRKGTFNIYDNVATDNGGGIHAIESDITIDSQSGEVNTLLVLAENGAREGGGVYLEGASKLQLITSNSSIKFAKNSADYGAAVYVDDTTNVKTCFTSTSDVVPASECFFYAPELKHGVKSIQFDRNLAHRKGSNLFGGHLDKCIPRIVLRQADSTLLSGSFVQEEHQIVDGLKYLQNISNVANLDSISSLPMQVCFCTAGVINCSLRTVTVRVKKGETFSLKLTAVNQVKSPVTAGIVSSLSSSEGKLDTNKRAKISNACTNVPYSVRSPHESERLSIKAEGPCRNAESSQLSVNVAFSPCSCPTGFERANETNNDCQCLCHHLISEHVTDCNATTKLFVRKKNSWISFSIQNGEVTFILARRCPFRYCRAPSFTAVSFNHSNSPDEQCSEGHTGRICGTCSKNFSVSLAHKRCLHCPDHWYLILLAVIVGTVLAGIGLIVLILTLNLTVAAGTISGFFFYANIVDVYDSTFLPLGPSSFPVLVIEWLNLDPGFDVCFVKGVDLYIHTWLRLVFPVYIISIVIVIIIVSHYSLRFSKLIGKRNPITTLATLVFLSFTNVLETAVVALRPTKLNYLTLNGSWQQTVWLPDGSVEYLRGKHVPMFLMGLLIVFLTVIYIILVFSWQWIVRVPNFWMLKWTKNQKLNFFLQAYQAPFCDRHRYWIGLLMLVRVLLYLISIFSEDSERSVPLLATTFVVGALFLLKLTYAKKLYKKWLKDILETVTIFNLFLFTIFTWYFLDDTQSQGILAYISTSFTFILFLCVITYHIYKYILISMWSKLPIRKTKILSHFGHRPMRMLDMPVQDQGDAESEDRFHELFGSLTTEATDVQLQVEQETQQQASTTFSVVAVDTPYTCAERVLSHSN